MNTSQGERQKYIRELTTTTLDYRGDWSALFDKFHIARTTFNGRLLLFLNAQLNRVCASLVEAKQLYARTAGYYNWSAMLEVPTVGFAVSTPVGIDTSEIGERWVDETGAIMIDHVEDYWVDEHGSRMIG
jgi:hypothetical protein